MLTVHDQKHAETPPWLGPMTELILIRISTKPVEYLFYFTPSCRQIILRVRTNTFILYRQMHKIHVHVCICTVYMYTQLFAHTDRKITSFFNNNNSSDHSSLAAFVHNILNDSLTTFWNL